MTTHIAFVADRSGSMMEMADPPFSKARRTTEGIQQMVRSQKALPGLVTFSLTQFDTSYETIEDWGDGSSILGDWQIQPRGGTALLDALGFCISSLGLTLAGMPEEKRPARVIVVTGTDGLENMSREYSLAQVRQMVTSRLELGWDFIFLGADIDAFEAGADIGISRASTLSGSSFATAAAWKMSDSSVSRARMTNTAVSYSSQERAQAGSD